MYWLLSELQPLRCLQHYACSLNFSRDGCNFLEITVTGNVTARQQLSTWGVGVITRYTDQVDMEGEFTAAVLTMVAKSSRPEMASRLAHSEKEVRTHPFSLPAIHGSGDVCLPFCHGSVQSLCMQGTACKGLPSHGNASAHCCLFCSSFRSDDILNPEFMLAPVILIAAPLCRQSTPS